MRYFVTGTDTGVGKTRVTAALAATMRARAAVTIVKLVQTGVDATEPGDAEFAGALAGVPSRELHRFRLAADPWNAAIAEGRTPLAAAALANELDAIAGDLVLEGAGGIAVPLSATESLADVALRADATAIVVVGLRLGCINHALLTLEHLARRTVPVTCVVLTEPWEPVAPGYRFQVERTLTAKGATDARARIVHLPFDSDARRSVATAVDAASFAIEASSRP